MVLSVRPCAAAKAVHGSSISSARSGACWASSTRASTR